MLPNVSRKYQVEEFLVSYVGIIQILINCLLLFAKKLFIIKYDKIRASIKDIHFLDKLGRFTKIADIVKMLSQNSK